MALGPEGCAGEVNPTIYGASVRLRAADKPIDLTLLVGELYCFLTILPSHRISVVVKCAAVMMRLMDDSRAGFDKI